MEKLLLGSMFKLCGFADHRPLNVAMCGVFLAACLFPSVPLRARTNLEGESQAAGATNSLAGSVMDQTGSVIVDATLSLMGTRDTPIAVTKTDKNGAFNFDKVPAGKYRLRVEAVGFKQTEMDVVAGAKDANPLRIVLGISTLSETVSVKVEESAVQVSQEVAENQNANNIDRDALDRVPVFDQDYITMLSRFLDDDTVGTSGVSLVVDGVEANGPGVSPSGVQEVRINQNPYSSRFARPGRARLEIVTKPGTPQFHGTVNFLVRNAVFDARNAFAASKPPESRYFSEGSLTGPLGPNKQNTFLLTMEQDDDNVQAIVFANGAGDALIRDNVPAPTRHFFTSLRTYHDFTSGDQVWIAYSYESESQRNQGVGGTVLREAGYTSYSIEHEVNVSYRHIFSPRWVNQLRFLVGHNDEPIFSATDAPQVIVEGYFTGGGAQADSKRTESHVDGTDFVTYSNGKHVLVFGVDVPDISRRGADDFTNFLGTYTFSDINTYAANRPSAYSVQTGNGHLIFWERTAAGFIEDSVRVKPNISISLGMRYYYQNYFNNDTNDFAPRFGIALSPSKKSKTVLRGGAGIFYDRSGPRAIADLLHFTSGGLGRFFLPAIPGGFVLYPVTPADLVGVPTSLVTLDPRTRIPYIFQYSFGIERQVTAKSTFSATYVGSRGIDLFRSRDVNAPLPPDYLARPDAQVGQVRQIESEGYQEANSLELTFRGKPAKFFSGQAQYILGKTYNNTSGIKYFPGNSNFPWLDWARSDNDRRHKFNFLGAFTLTDLFSLGVALEAFSGKPVNVTTGLDSNGDGIFNDRPLNGLVPRNSLHGPGLLNLDLNVERDFHFKAEKKGGPTLTVALNAFNVLNHVNDVTYIGVLGSPDFGRGVLADPGRRLQLNLEFKF
jgi:Carboxypeptidase regulatory-like domain